MKRVLISFFIGTIILFSTTIYSEQNKLFDNKNIETDTTTYFNGHIYRRVSIPANFTWHQARDSAIALGGYLAVVTSKEENDFLANFSNPFNTFLGGTDEASEGTWSWISGESWSFTAWRTGEPNNVNGGEDFIGLSPTDSMWNDMRNWFTSTQVFIAEYDNNLSIQNVFVENDTLNLYVLNHTPEISWNFSDPITQTDFEIAVGTDNDWAFAEMWNPAPMTSVDTFITYNGSTLIDGETYYGRLKVSNGTAWTDWFEFSFRMNSKPTTPITISPINDTLTNSIPTLWIQNSSDAEGDSLFYDFSGNKFTGTGLVFEPLLVGNNIVEDSDSTGLAVTFPLEENSLFYWEVRAFDGYEYSDWTTLLESSFWVNDVNEAPSAPSVLNPNETSSPLYNMQPTFEWTISTDPDPLDIIYYRLHVAIDSNYNFETLFDSIPHPMFAIPQVYFSLPFPLEKNEGYWWKVDAIDQGNNISTSNSLHFWTSCCIADRGNANGGSDDGTLAGSVTVADLVFLVAYMFQGGAEPACMDEADVNGSGGINISDLVSLVAYMFQGGASPAHCP